MKSCYRAVCCSMGGAYIGGTYMSIVTSVNGRDKCYLPVYSRTVKSSTTSR